MKAIPTKYAGVQFRSRLEAKWAAFFDLLGWPWQYEPYDLNGWIPDFSLIGAHNEILVEVKPTAIFLPEIAAEMETAAPKAYGLMLVGHSVRYEKDQQSIGGIGWAICQKHALLNERWFPERLWRSPDGQTFDFLFEPSGQPFRGFFTGESFEHGAENRWDAYEFREVVARWNEAGNRVQWKAPK